MMSTPSDREPEKSKPERPSQYKTVRYEKKGPPVESFDDNRSLGIVVAIIAVVFLLIALTPQIGVLAAAAAGFVVFGIWVLYRYIQGDEKSRRQDDEDKTGEID